MDKIKKVFSPGSSKDDEVLYGDADTRRRESATKTHDSQPPQLDSTEGTEKKESGGVLRQTLKPDGEEYDEYHGTPATTVAPSEDPRKLSTTAEGQKDSTITHQILNPNREKYDEQRYGTTAITTDAPAGHAAPQLVSPDAQLQTDKGQKDHSIVRQILNPHGDKYNAEGYGATAHVVGQSSDTTGSSTGAGVGSFATQDIPDRTAQTTTETHVGPTTTTMTTTSSQPITERSHPLGGQTAGGAHINPVSAPEDRAVETESHLGRDAGIAGGLVGTGVEAGAYSASQHNRAGDHITPTTAQANTAVLDRPHPLGGHDASGDHINPISAPEDPAAALSTAGTHSHLGRDAGIAGAPATGLTGSDVSSQLNSAPRDVQDATYTARQFNIPGDVCDGTPVEGYVHHTQGPHSTDTANRLDPHVARDTPLQASSATTQAPASSGQEHHYGRDAALGVGAGTAGLAAYESTQGRGDTGPASKTIGPHDSNIANIVDPKVQPQPEKMKDSTTTEPHSSDIADKLDPGVEETLTLQGTEGQHQQRDAALAGGAGALGGAGVYAATRDHDTPITEQLASAQGTQTQPAYHATTDASAATQPGTNLPDSRHRNKEAAHAGEAGLAGAGVGAGAGAFAPGVQSAATKTGPEAGRVDTPVQHTGDPKAVAATHRDDNTHSSSHTKDEEKEKKPSLIHRILHPGEGKEKENDSHRDDKKHDHDSSSHQSHHEHNKLHKKALGEGKTTEEAAHHTVGNDGRVIEPHTGLPMNVAKYGTGQGGTDGAGNIEGYHETDPAIRNASIGTGVGAGLKEGHAQPGQEGVAGPDWDAIKKANTPY